LKRENDYCGTLSRLPLTSPEGESWVQEFAAGHPYAAIRLANTQDRLKQAPYPAFLLKENAKPPEQTTLKKI